jgi:membrane-associated phospholipid phosphatase
MSFEAGRPSGPREMGSTPAPGGRPATSRARLLTEERYVERRVRLRTYALAVGLMLLGLVTFFALLVAVLNHTGFERLDRPVEQWFGAQRSRDVTSFMTVLAVVFGPVGMPIIVLTAAVVWAVVAKHLWRPLLLLAGMATGVVLAQVLAPLVRHPRPPVDLMLGAPDHTFSFPSGHVLGMSDFFLILAFLLASRVRRAWFTAIATLLAVVCVAAQAVSRLYLGYHWLTDVSASVALSIVILGAVIAIDTRRTVRVDGEQIRGRFSTLQRDGT